MKHPVARRRAPAAFRALSLLVLPLLALLLPPGLSAAPASSLPVHELTSHGLVYQTPAMEKVTVRKDLPYKQLQGSSLKLDVYYPPGYKAGTLRPGVVFVNGVGDTPQSRVKEWAAYTSWPRLVASRGFLAVTFEARPGPANDEDIRDLFKHLDQQGRSLGIDPSRIGAWACSANASRALPFLMRDAGPGVEAAVIYYGTGNVENFRPDLPLMLVRAGRDGKFLNDQIDRLVARALTQNAPWKVVNAPVSIHAFDVLENTPESRRLIVETMDFLAERLEPADLPGPPPSETRQATAFWFSQDHEKAAPAYQAFVDRNPRDAVAWLRLGQAQLGLRQTEAARKSFEQAIALGQGGQAHYQLGLILLGQKEHRKAAEQMEKALETGVGGALNLYNAACAFALDGRKDLALRTLERAVDLGFNSRQTLLEDADLASLRSDARFQALLARVP